MIRLITVIFLAFAGQLKADVIEVRSGEHFGFTRLVLAIPSGREWRLGRNGDGYAIESGELSDSYDTSTAFDLIGRSRVAEISLGARPDRMEISLACDCHATATRWQTNWVVVDIVDGPAPLGSSFEAPLPANFPDALSESETSRQTLDAFAMVQPVKDLNDFAFYNAPTSPQNERSRLVLPLVIGGPNLANPTSAIPVNVIEAYPDLEAESVPAGAMADQISETEQSIIESLARAASNGLLDLPAGTEHDAVSESNQSDATAQASESMISEDLAQEINADPPGTQHQLVASSLSGFSLDGIDSNQPGVTSRTSLDAIEQPRALVDASSAVGDSCLDDALFVMEGWGDDRTFSDQLGERLSFLTTEFDVFPEGAVEKLAKTFLFFGFGREALQSLKIDGADSQQRRVMAAMAHVVDEEPDPSGLLDSQLGCATQAAIWASLSRGSLVNTTEAERVKAIEGFRSLPPMLRGHLGVRLAQLFVIFGDIDSAQTILEAARTHATAARAQTNMIAAEITLFTEGADVAIPQLNNTAAIDIRFTPAALIQLINLTLDDGLPVNPELLTLADSMVYEHRGTEIGAALIATQVRALTAAGEYNQALALLGSDVKPLSAQDMAALRSAAILSLSDHADDAAFLDFAFDTLPDTGNANVENVVATRLLGLGFADRAGAILSSPASGADARDRIYLQADIAIAIGNYDEVVKIMAGMSDPRAVELMARTLAAQGDFMAAASMKTALPGVEPDAAEAWRAGEWSTLENSDDPLLRAATNAVLAAPEPQNPQALLASGRALLDQANATQDLTGQLLTRFVVDSVATFPGTTN